MPVELWIEDLTDGGVVYRRAGNLSRGGLYLDQTIPLPIGSKVKLRFALPDEGEPVTVTGQIVSINSRERLGMGVKFIDIDRAVQDLIASYTLPDEDPGPGGASRRLDYFTDSPMRRRARMNEEPPRSSRTTTNRWTSPPFSGAGVSSAW
jgi:uncharacterized protein (TIGR02266 family)